MTLNCGCPLSDTIRTYKKTRDKKLRDELISAYMPVVESQARRLCRKLPSCVEYDDLVSAGSFGLMSSIESFDPERGVQFANYCAGRVRGAMLDELRKLDWVPRLARERRRDVSRARVTLYNELMREPTEAEMALEMRMDVSDYREMADKARIASMIPLGYHEHTSRLENQHRLDPAEISERHELCETATRCLNNADRYVLKRYYYENATLKEIGDAVGLSESRVCQVITRIRDRLHDVMTGVTRFPRMTDDARTSLRRSPRPVGVDEGWGSAPVCDEVPKVRIHRARKPRTVTSDSPAMATTGLSLQTVALDLPERGVRFTFDAATGKDAA